MTAKLLSDPTVPAGERIGPYALVRLIGRGGMGTVFEARHSLLGRKVAVKTMHPRLAQNPVAVARFLREGQAAAGIRHPRVVDVFDLGDHEGSPYLVMELVEGVDLAAHLRQRCPMAIPSAVDCILDVLTGVAAAHDAGVVHRDLKPGNVRLGTDHRGEHRVKILDFGISKIQGSDQADLTGSNETLGTTSYMAPEQLRSPPRSDERSDVYSLGVILYECLTGRLPFQGGSTYERMHAILTAPIAPPAAVRPAIPSGLEAVVLRALDRDPDRRFSGARQLARALMPFASEPSSWPREFAGSGRRGERAAPAEDRDADADAALPETTLAVTSLSTRAPRRRSRWGVAAGVAAAVLASAAALGVAGERRRAVATRGEIAPAPATGEASPSPSTPIAAQPSAIGGEATAPTSKPLPVLANDRPSLGLRSTGDVPAAAAQAPPDANRASVPGGPTPPAEDHLTAGRDRRASNVPDAGSRLLGIYNEM